MVSQSFSQVGILPRVNYTHRLNDHFTLNGTVFSEITPFDAEVGAEEFPSKVLNLTFIVGFGYNLNPNNILITSYLFRIIDPFESEARLEHRLIQQYIKIQHLGSWRLRYHLRFEERFIESAISNGKFNAITRLSFSFGWDAPLQGRILNPNEFYLNSISSFFVQPTKPRTAFNNLNEFYLGLGYQTKKMGRFEIGPEAKIAVRNSDGDIRAIVFMDFIWYPNF